MVRWAWAQLGGCAARGKRERACHGAGREGWLEGINLLSDIFTYAFRGGGKYILAIGTGLFLLSELFAFAWIFGLIAQWILFAYFCSVFFQIIESTATGGSEAPEFPDTANLFEDLFVPMLKVIGVWVVCFGPALGYGIFSEGEMSEVLFFVLLAAGVAYFPMAMTAVAVLGYLGALSPHIVLPAMARAGGLYWLAVFLLVMLYLGIQFVLTVFGGIPVIGAVLAAALGMYLLMTNGRTLGIIYRERREEMNWI